MHTIQSQTRPRAVRRAVSLMLVCAGMAAASTAGLIATSASPAGAPILPIMIKVSGHPLGFPKATIGKPYHAQLLASGGRAPYSWRVVSGKLPAGIKLNSSTGTVKGTATTKGTYKFTNKATD